MGHSGGNQAARMGASRAPWSRLACRTETCAAHPVRYGVPVDAKRRVRRCYGEKQSPAQGDSRSYYYLLESCFPEKISCGYLRKLL